MGRFCAVMEALRGQAFDAVLLTGKPNLYYASGFDSSGSRALVTRQNAYFLCDGRYIEEARRLVTDAQVRLIRTAGEADGTVRELLEREGVSRLGFEEETVTVAEYERLRQKLGVELVPAGGLMSDLRSVKESCEIRLLQEAQKLAEKAFWDTMDFIRIGRTERETAAFLQYRMLTYGAEKMSFDPIVVSGPNSSLPHGKPSDRAFEAGDFLTMDFGCVLNGYCSDMTRTVAFDHVTEEMSLVYETVRKAQAAGMAAARPGSTGRDVHQAGAEVIAQAGYGPYFTHGFGHGIGVQCHEQPMASPANERPLRPGNAISAEPGIYLPGRFGVRIEDIVVITEDGCESLMTIPKDLMIIG